MSIALPVAPAIADDLSLTRLHLMRAGYLLMGVGLVIVKWPLLPDADALPLYEGVTLCLLTAMSLLAFLGLRYPVKLLPLLLFESAWKLLWLALVALPRAAEGNLDAATADIVVQLLLRRAHPRGHPVAVRVAQLRARHRRPLAMTGALVGH